jgi:hypothetical protein
MIIILIFLVFAQTAECLQNNIKNVVYLWEL